MDRKRRLPPPAEAAEDGSGSRVAKRWRALLVQEILHRVDFREAIAELLRRLPVELEAVIRRVVQEQLQLIANHTTLASRLLTNQDKEIKYRLHFQNTPARELFTYSRIVAADGTKLRIAIMDSNLREVITSDPWSSVKVEIVVVKGDFGGDDKKVWTKEEFKACVVSQRKDKGPLLTGQLEIKLTNGIGYLASAKFTDNSSWTKTQEFSLAMKLSPSEHIQERVLEGISEPFRVKDRRVEANQKHHPPLLTDEVWRLEWIMKNGVLHKRLEKSGIHNVQQFLQALTMGPERLRSLLGDEASKKGISDKRWDAIIAHAKECHQGEDLCSYNLAGQHMGDLSASSQNSVDNGKRPASKNPKLPSHLAPMNVTSIPESSSPDPQVPYHCNRPQDGATIQAGYDELSKVLFKFPNRHSVQEHSYWQPNAQNDELSNVPFKFQDSHSVQEHSSFQETNISNDLSIQMGGLPPIGSIPMPSTPASATVSCIPIPQPNPQVPPYPAYPTAHYDEPAVHGDFQGLCQDSNDEQGIHQLQQPVSLQTNGLHPIDISDEDLFGTSSGSSGMYRNMDDKDFDVSAMVYSFLPDEDFDVSATMFYSFPTHEVVPKYKNWIRLRSILRSRNLMSKLKDCRRTGVGQLKCPNIDPSTSLDAPGAETGY